MSETRKHPLAYAVLDGDGRIVIGPRGNGASEEVYFVRDDDEADDAFKRERANAAAATYERYSLTGIRPYSVVALDAPPRSVEAECWCRVDGTEPHENCPTHGFTPREESALETAVEVENARREYAEALISLDEWDRSEEARSMLFDARCRVAESKRTWIGRCWAVYRATKEQSERRAAESKVNNKGGAS